MRAGFLAEYSSHDAVLRYTKDTAGYGISYLLEHDYAKIYEAALQLIPTAARREGIRILEFGCGGAMNLIRLVLLAQQRGIEVQQAYGTDFSPTMIHAANLEADKYLPPGQRKRVKLLVAGNEALPEDMARQLDMVSSSLSGSFHLVLGVNTIRYCHWLGEQLECAQGVFGLLEKGGLCVIIDMNSKFPLFRSRLRDQLTRHTPGYRLPSLEDYVRPFTAVGFEVLRRGNFGWIPHSAGPRLAKLCAGLTPLLDTLLPTCAMRSLVIARKPA